MRYVIIVAIFLMFIFCFPAPDKKCKPSLLIEFYYQGKFTKAITTHSFAEFQMNRGYSEFNYPEGVFLADSVHMTLMK